MPINDNNDIPHPENLRVLLQQAHYEVGKHAELDLSHNHSKYYYNQKQCVSYQTDDLIRKI